MHQDFGERIRIKSNAPSLLEAYLQKKGFIPLHREKTHTLVDYIPTLKESIHQKKFILHIGGGVCDVYQPAELEVGMTRKLLQIIHDYEFPIFILTKNKNVLRDMDLLKKINEETYACCSFTITLTDEKTQKIFEPGASTTQERFEAIKILREDGIHSGVYFYPVLPLIGDTEENMHTLYGKAKEMGAEFVHCWGLTLKPGRSKEEFLHTLEKHFPALLPKYRTLYGNNDKYGNVDNEQSKKMGLVRPEVKGFTIGYEYKLPYAAKRYVPEGCTETNVRMSEVLLRMAYVKGFLNERREARLLTRASRFLETYQKDAATLGEDEWENLLPKEVHPHVREFVTEKRSKSLEKLEEEAYRALSS